eukprot:scaffold248986_cov30-Tisochrysis_lutea.AAC.3
MLHGASAGMAHDAQLRPRSTEVEQSERTNACRDADTRVDRSHSHAMGAPGDASKVISTCEMCAEIRARTLSARGLRGSLAPPCALPRPSVTAPRLVPSDSWYAAPRVVSMA